jgi:hypothetical protein
MSILRFGCLAFDEGVSSSTKSSEYGSGRPEIAARNDETRGSFGCDAGYKKLWNLSVKVQTKANPCRANSIQQRQQAISSIFKILDRFNPDCNRRNVFKGLRGIGSSL